MWSRELIKCPNCGKITNLRYQIPEVETLPMSFNCLGCKTELRAILHTNFELITYNLDVEKGIVVKGDYDSGDYFIEFSDTLPTSKPSTVPHDILLPTLRIPFEKFKELKISKELKKSFSKEEWDKIKDLLNAYNQDNKPVVKKIATELLSKRLPKHLLAFNHELDYQNIFFIIIQTAFYPWINFDKIDNLTNYLNQNIFTEQNVNNHELLTFVNDNFTSERKKNCLTDITDIIERFINNRNFFLYSSTNISNQLFVSIEDFIALKNLYTDCFEFLGRYGDLVFALQNFKERTALDNVPVGCPRNIVDVESFKDIDNGKKKEIFELSTDKELKAIYGDCYDNKLRNGINHYKAKIDKTEQIISYYPSKNKPEEEYQINYIDFLSKTLDCFSSVLMIAQILKFSNIYPYIINNVSEKSNVPKRKIKIGRNDPCPCNSGLKYKKCCGRNI